jgi:hypothetical protein
MGYANSFADYSWFTGYVERLAAVTPEWSQTQPANTCAPDARVIGVTPPMERRLAMTEQLFSTDALPGPDDITRQSFDNGSLLLTRPNMSSPAVLIRVICPGLRV